jgi:hypothetical protein
MKNRVIPDFGTGELAAALELFEELATTLMWWERDAQAPDGDGWRPPAGCSPGVLVPVHERLLNALRGTQTTQDWDGRNRTDVEPAGPQWYTTGGYGLASLSFIDVSAADVDALGAFVAALAQPRLDTLVEEAVDDVNERLVDQPGQNWSAQQKRRQEHGAVAAVAQLHALLTLTPEPDDLAVLTAAHTAARKGAQVRLDAAAEAAWHRVVDACHRALVGGDRLNQVLTRWAMASRDHT